MLLKRKSVRLLYDAAENNFGDVLNPVLIRHLCGCEVTTAGMKNCEMLAIGSLLGRFLSPHFVLSSLFRRSVLVWGTGYVEIGQRRNMRFLMRRMNILAVRGKLTLERFRKLQGVKIANNVVLGDPGLLSRELIDTYEIKKKYDLGVVPHYCDKNSHLFDRIKIKNKKIIDIQQSPVDFLHDLAECRAVLSSALHGIIAADSLGIPNRRMICGDNILGGDWKYDDYYSAFGVRSHDRIHLARQDVTEVDLIKFRCMSQDNVTTICEQLKQVFPIKEGR